MGRWELVLLFCLVAGRSAFAEDTGLKALSAKLIAIRGTHGVNTMRDAGPELTPIKRLLRQWVEENLPPFEKQDDPEKFAQHLSAALRAAGLTCERDDKRCQEPIDGDAPGATEFDGRGYLSDVSLSYLDFQHYLVLKTNVGVRCGFDESAYIYEWRNKSWYLLLQTEQDRYDEKHYAPQNFMTIRRSPTDIAWNAPVPKPPLILTLGYSPWCSSNWQMLYTRLWRASEADTSPTPLVDTADTLFIDDDDAEAKLSTVDALIEFKGRSVDGDVLIREHVRHYIIHGDRAERIAPVALNPKDFIDEWLTQPWAESVSWTEVGSQAVARAWYTRFHGSDDNIFGEYDDDTPTRCRSDLTLWQVGFTKQARPTNQEVSSYFLVRWMAPYRFTLVKIQKTKFPGCDIKDAMPDNPGTLFPFPSSAQ